MVKSICIISKSVVRRDARLLRQIKYLVPYYDLTVIGYGDPHPSWTEMPNVELIQIFPNNKMDVFNRFYSRLLRISGKFWHKANILCYCRQTFHIQALKFALLKKFDAYQANDYHGLPAAAEAAKKHHSLLVFDAHEHAPTQYEYNRSWKLWEQPVVKAILREYSPRIDASMTVAPAIANRYHQELGIDPIVVMNATERVSDLQVRDIDPEHIQLIHHGGASRNRRLETMIEALGLCDRRYTLTFMLVESGYPKYTSELKQIGEELAPGRVFFHTAVDPEEIVKTILKYDVGFYILDPISYNQQISLPNKFFDFIAAGLPVCIGPSPSMAVLVKQYGFGCVAPSFKPEDVAKTLNNISTEQWVEMKEAAIKAYEHINVKTEMGKMVTMYNHLFTNKGS